MAVPDLDIADKLAADVGSLTKGVNLFRGKVRDPNQFIPHEAVFVLARGGPRPDSFLDGNSGVHLRQPTVQIFVRSNPREFLNGQTLARTVKNALHSSTIAGYISVKIRESEPYYQTEYDDGSHIWTMNADLLLKE